MPQLNSALLATIISACLTGSVMSSSLTSKAEDRPPNIVGVEDVNPFTHFAYIPQESDLASIRFESVKTVKVATQRKSTSNVRYCEEVMRGDPGGSMYCPYTELQSPSTAWQVTYSYQGQPMASDEYGNGHFTFSVYLHPEELGSTVRKKLFKHKIDKADAEALFDLRTYREPVRRVVIDNAVSTFCDGNFVDGVWTHMDSKCEDKIEYKTITDQSTYITVRVVPTVTGLSENASQ